MDPPNPNRTVLLQGITGVMNRIAQFKEAVRTFYFEVALSPYRCEKCQGRLRMDGLSECLCVTCGYRLDPTVVFQLSPCCRARLVRKTFHYACSRCHKTVASRFLFDERIFDQDYFREMMRESRARTKEKREMIRKLLAGSRSGPLPLLEEPCLESIPGLIEDLNAFIQNGQTTHNPLFDLNENFSMDEYRKHILSKLSWDTVPFSTIAPLIDDHRRDRVRRFITLVFMQNDREVEITQEDDDLLVQKIYHEAYT